MPVVTCHIVGCNFVTGDVGDAVGAVQLGHHLSTEHGPARQQAMNIKKPDRPLIKDDATDRDWQTFLFEWEPFFMELNAIHLPRFIDFFFLPPPPQILYPRANSR